MRASLLARMTMVVALAIVLTMIAACASPSAPAAQPAAAKPAAEATTGATQPANVPDDLKPLAQPYKATMSVSTSLITTPAVVALEKGFFAKRGIQLQTLTINSGQEAQKAFETGTSDYGGGGVNIIQTLAASGGAGIVYFQIQGDSASVISDRPLAIIAHPQSGIRAGHPEDLKGKTVGLSLGGTGEMYLLAVLDKAGVDKKDVKMVNVPGPQWLTVLQNKNVDAVSGWEPFNSVIAQGLPGAVEVVRGGGHIGYTSYQSVSIKTLKEKPDFVLRSAAALAEAAHWIRQNPDGAGEIVTHWIEGLDAKVAAAALRNVPFDPRFTTYTQQVWDLSNQFLVKQGRLKEPVPKMEGLFDTTAINKVINDHPEYFDDLRPAQIVNFAVK